MTEKEAIKLIKGGYIDDKLLKTAEDLACDALAKQIPQKPEIKSDGIYRVGFCPRSECGCVLSVNYEYCPFCGQKIDIKDWSGR